MLTNSYIAGTNLTGRTLIVPYRHTPNCTDQLTDFYGQNCKYSKLVLKKTEKHIVTAVCVTMVTDVTISKDTFHSGLC